MLLLIPTLSDGGAEKVAANLSLQLCVNYNLTLVLFHKKFGKMNYPYKGEIIYLNTLPSTNLFVKIFRFIVRFYKIKKIKKQKKIDVSISFLEGMNVLNLLTKRSEKIIISVRQFRSKDNTVKTIVFYIYDFLMKKIYNTANSIVVPSKGICNDLVNNFNINESKIKLINNPCNYEAIQHLAGEELEKGHQKIFHHPVIINIGSLSEYKGQWHLIRIFSECKKHIQNLKLVILGDGRLKEYLINLAKELNLKTFSSEQIPSSELIESYDIYFLGFQNNPYKFLSRAKVFAFTSLTEGFPNVLVEALACGTPVISADCRSGPREILAPDTDYNFETKVVEFAHYGVLMPPLDGCFYLASDSLTKEEELWSETLSRTLLDEKRSRTYAKSGIERCRDLNLTSIIKKWEDIF